MYYFCFFFVSACARFHSVKAQKIRHNLKIKMLINKLIDENSEKMNCAPGSLVTVSLVVSAIVKFNFYLCAYVDATSI